eukprot:TRINITY_DN2669_c0_g1_i5.p1 TRINITY_DN2669_c0_g1~~TRINITY_DN2669_c0_g1_i5.p1  ORF type:complete len:741 (+),score=167.20 TRINITY_DN2669_c0_g1_i5:88-2310(+)
MIHHSLYVIGLVTIVLAQTTPQTGPLSITEIVNGNPITQTLYPSSISDALHVQLYRFWVPENAQSVNLTFSFSDFYCNTLNFQVSTFGVPCSASEYTTSSPTNPCANSWSISSFTSTGNGKYYSKILTNKDQTSLFKFGTNRWWYFAVGKATTQDNLDTCSYTLDVKTASSCPSGQVSVFYYDALTCSPYTSVTANGVQKVVLTHTNTNGANPHEVFKLNIPQNTAYVRLTLNSTSDSATIFGRNFGATSGITGQYDCIITQGENVDIGSYHISDLICYTPTAGNFFFVIRETKYQYSIVATFDTKVCPTGTGGYNCTAVSTDLFTSTFPQILELPYAFTGGDGATYGGVRYFYFDTGNVGMNKVLLNVTLLDMNRMYFLVRRDAFPTAGNINGYDDSSEYLYLYHTSGAISVNDFDTQVPGRIYFGVVCVDTASYDPTCKFQITLNNAMPITSGPLTTRPVTSSPLTTNALTTAEITTSPLTTAQLSTAAVTSGPLTTQAVTSNELTTAQVTTAPLTSGDVTSNGLTTAKVTTSPMTTQPLTTKPLTTKKITSGALTTSVESGTDTSGDITTKSLTTQKITGGSLTTSAVTSGAVTTGVHFTTGVIEGPIDVTLRFDVDIEDFNETAAVLGLCRAAQVENCDTDDIVIKDIWEGSVYFKFEMVGDLAEKARDVAAFAAEDPDAFAEIVGYPVLSVGVDPTPQNPITSDGTTGDAVESSAFRAVPSIVVPLVLACVAAIV